MTSRPRSEIDAAINALLLGYSKAVAVGANNTTDEADFHAARSRLSSLFASKDAEIERLREDAERLDWLEKADVRYFRETELVGPGEIRTLHSLRIAFDRTEDNPHGYADVSGTTLREAIDAARTPNRGTTE